MNFFPKLRPTPTGQTVITIKENTSEPAVESFYRLFDLLKHEGMIHADAKPSVYSLFFMLGRGRLK